VLSGFDAAAVAATYGSVSAVTFVTAVQSLERQHIAFGGYMSAAMALMESPAIIMAIVFANALRQRQAAGLLGGVHGASGGVAVLANTFSAKSSGVTLGKVLHESFTDGAQLLLIGAMLIGILSGDAGKAAMQPFSGDLFKGMLAFFLLDMGLLTARSFSQLRGKSPWLLAYALVGPLVHATLALGLCSLLNIPTGDTILLMVLAASASYIAVPAVMRHAVPEANASLYFGLSLGITFPLNILFGIPLYTYVAAALTG
jgi:hypothetical protein